MSDPVRRHYELYPYPHYPLLASVRRCDTYALNLSALWTRFNGELPPRAAQRVLIAGCGSFAPYPFALANPETEVWALDLSERSLRRARLHCLLHRRHNVTFRCGDLLDPVATTGNFGLIDAYGVLHHLADPLAGLRTLAARLVDGGILRIMLYSRYARRSEESVRRALRLLGIADPDRVRMLLRRAPPGSRLQRFAQASEEAGSTAGLADALLHPRVHTYRIAEFMSLVHQSGLEPLLFAHDGALPDIGREVERISRLEAIRESPGNFVLYLGHGTRGPCGDNRDTLLALNPCLAAAVGRLPMGTTRIAARLGSANPPLGRHERQFLRQFTQPRPWDSLSPQEQTMAAAYRHALFLLHYRQQSPDGNVTV